MKERKPLLFIQNPVIQAFRPPPREESTSLFEPVRQPPRKPESLESLIDEAVFARLKFLHEPFRRQIYCPLEIITDEQTIKGKIHKLERDVLWMEQDDELTPIELSRIQDIQWKQQSFIL